MGERSEDWIGGFWLARIGHAGIEWTVTEWREVYIEVYGMEES